MTRSEHRPSGALRLLVVLTGLVTLVVGGATAYVLDGDSWPHPAGGAVPMTEGWALCANTPDVNAFLSAGAILSAAQTWGGAGARFRFGNATLLCNAAPALDGVNQVRWDVGTLAYPSLAATYAWSNAADQIFEVDIIFEDIYSWSAATPTPQGSLDIQSVMLHEFGHWVGLDHSVAPAVMQPSINYGVQRRVLTQDDKNGIIAIYGCG